MAKVQVVHPDTIGWFLKNVLEQTAVCLDCVDYYEENEIAETIIGSEKECRDIECGCCGCIINENPF
jgi:hypothetical protein